MASGENVLWVVKRQVNIGHKDYSYEQDKLFVFRTKVAGNKFRAKKNAASKKYRYTVPVRATWGPEQ
jgi:tRNA U38,U39,U40 pseudouridine synthase TruA